MQRPADLRPRGSLPHICFVAPLAWPVFARDPSVKLVGGAEVQQSILARALVRAGHRVSMVCLDFGQPDGVVVDGVTVHKAYRRDAGIPVLRFIHPRLTGIWRAMRAADADIYYQRSSTMLTGIVAEFCRLHGKRSVYAGASDTDFIPGRQMIQYRRDRWLFERGLRRVDRLVVQNPNQAQSCQAHFRREATLIPSAYELPPDARPGAGDCVVWVGTVHEAKRPELLLEIARRLPHRRFVMVGGAGHDDDSGRESYYDLIRRAAAELPNLELTGFLPLAQAEPWFDRARVLLNTSPSEGVPNTFLQAWARGVPSVAWVDIGARVDGQPLYPVVDSVEGAAAEIERLFTDAPYQARTAARCREYFERNHSSREVIERYRQLFDELVPGAG
jgi:glycosyltransferase involved in cell wall biosynthesis